MEPLESSPITAEVVATLENDIKKFADSLPYWSKYLADKILKGVQISDIEIDTALSYLKEELKLIPETPKPAISIQYTPTPDAHKADTVFERLEQVEGVNALAEGVPIEFDTGLTVIYGENGSGKSGYVRLFKQAFYAKSPEDILPNIHAENPKPVSAKFTFRSEMAHSTWQYPENSAALEFEQYSVFDTKGVFKQLDQRSEFEFRPAGLSFFGELTNALQEVERKLEEEKTKKGGHSLDDLLGLFDGDSEIKEFIQTISASTSSKELDKYAPFSEEDVTKRKEAEKEHDELHLSLRDTEARIKELDHIKLKLQESKAAIEKLNVFFSSETLGRVQEGITSCLEKEHVAKREGIQNFQTEQIKGIGTAEWRAFILAAQELANLQEDAYPKEGGACLLCHQALPEESRNLISKYWDFIKSVAEENAKKAQEHLSALAEKYERRNFDLFPDDNILTVWLEANAPDALLSLKESLEKQKELSEEIISDLTAKTAVVRSVNQVDVSVFLNIETYIDEKLRSYRENTQQKELERLWRRKNFYVHKEKFNTHLKKFQDFIEREQWFKKASKASFPKRKVTEAEKMLSERHFNQRYIDIFNEECKRLNASFGIEVQRIGSAGKSYRQLLLKGRKPNTVLSEGEQKVIALADFLAETRLSEINRGLIFDDPVTSLDDKRKKEIGQRLAEEAIRKQVIVFTHDLLFLSVLIEFCQDNAFGYRCHWIENNGAPGQVWLDNTPSYETKYRNSDPVKQIYAKAKAADCPPELRESYLRNGFAALRTCYEVLVINGVFKNVVQRYNERVSMERLKTVHIDPTLIAELEDGFAQCCRHMEGHTHSDKYSYRKPTVEYLNEEMRRYDEIKSKIGKSKPAS